MKGKTSQEKFSSNGKFHFGIEDRVTYVNDLQVSVQ